MQQTPGKSCGPFLFLLIVAVALASPALSRIQGEQPPPKGNGQKMTFATGGPVTLGSEPTRAVLQANQLTSKLEALRPNQRIYLVLRDMHAAEQPGILYHVYIGLPEAATPEKNDFRYLGMLNFFNAVPLESGASSSRSIFRSYDATPVFKALQQRNELSDRITVTFVPSGTPAANAKASIGQLEIVEQ